MPTATSVCGSDRATGSILNPDGTFQVLGGSDGLSSPTDVALYDMFEDHDGAIGSARAKVEPLRRRANHIGQLDARSSGERVWSIVEDATGDLWLSLDRGIVRFP